MIGPSLGPTLAQGSGKGDFRSTSATASEATALAARKLPGAEDTAEVAAKATKATAPAKATDRLVAVATSKAAAKAAVSIEATERLGCKGRQGFRMTWAMVATAAAAREAVAAAKVRMAWPGPPHELMPSPPPRQPIIRAAAKTTKGTTTKTLLHAPMPQPFRRHCGGVSSRCGNISDSVVTFVIFSAALPHLPQRLPRCSPCASAPAASTETATAVAAVA